MPTSHTNSNVLSKKPEKVALAAAVGEGGNRGLTNQLQAPSRIRRHRMRASAGRASRRRGWSGPGSTARLAGAASVSTGEGRGTCNVHAASQITAVNDDQTTGAFRNTHGRRGSAGSAGKRARSAPQRVIGEPDVHAALRGRAEHELESVALAGRGRHLATHLRLLPEAHRSRRAERQARHAHWKRASANKRGSHTEAQAQARETEGNRVNGSTEKLHIWQCHLGTRFRL